MMRNRLGILIVGLPVLLSFGCAGDEPVSDDAAKGWRATQLAYGNDVADWQQGVDIDGSLDVSLDCPDGGSYRAVGTYVDEKSFDLSVAFDGCSADGVVIDGDLALHAEVDISGNDTRVSMSYEGELTWSGEANGSCGIDVTASVAVEVDDDSADVDAEFHGDICGYDDDAVVHAGSHD
jgi:hypothetical protein